MNLKKNVIAISGKGNGQKIGIYAQVKMVYASYVIYSIEQ